MSVVVDQQEYRRFLEFQKVAASMGGVAPQSPQYGAGPVMSAPTFPTSVAPLPGQVDGGVAYDAVAPGGMEVGEDGSELDGSPVAVLSPTGSPFDDLVCRDELARLLGVSEKTIDRMAEDHRLPKGLDLSRKVWSKRRSYDWIIMRMEKQDEETLAEMSRLKMNA